MISCEDMTGGCASNIFGVARSCTKDTNEVTLTVITLWISGRSVGCELSHLGQGICLEHWTVASKTTTRDGVNLKIIKNLYCFFIVHGMTTSALVWNLKLSQTGMPVWVHAIKRHQFKWEYPWLRWKC